MQMEALEHRGARAAEANSMLSVLRADGSADPDSDPGLGRDRVVALYEAMVRTRVVGERFEKLAESGRIGFFPHHRGTEAAVIGATFALREQDWIFPTHGDFGAALLRGMPIVTLAHRAFASASDPLVGRDMPGALSARSLMIASTSAPAATHLPHAVGVGWSARRRGQDVVTAAYFDAREIAAADFHTGLNFAGVMRAPTIFVCRTRAGEESAADHAVAYGLPSVRCDGSDVLAVVRAVGDALDRAAEGGATVIDLVITGEGDAIERAREHLVRIGAWDEAKERAHVKRIEEELASAIDAASRAGSPAPRTLVDHVFATTTPELEAQRSAIANAPRR